MIIESSHPLSPVRVLRGFLSGWRRLADAMDYVPYDYTNARLRALEMHIEQLAFSAHSPHNVHSNVQMRASVGSGGKSVLQHSQPGRSLSMALLRQSGFQSPTRFDLTFTESDAD